MADSAGPNETARNKREANAAADCEAGDQHEHHAGERIVVRPRATRSLASRTS